MSLANKKIKVLFLDFWSDKNRGDAAMQVVQAKLIRSILPESHLAVMTAFGANQSKYLSEELDETVPLVDELVGGLRVTFVPFEQGMLGNAFIRKSLNILALSLGILMLPVWFGIGKTGLFDFLFPMSWRASVRALRDSDLVIWNGRNFRVDKKSREPYEIWNLLYNPLVTILFGKPIAAVGASIWDLKHPFARFLLRHIMGKAYFVSLREESSMRNAEALLAGKKTRLALLPDLSLALLNEINNSKPKEIEKKHFNRLGVTVVDWINSGMEARQNYINALGEYLQEYLKNPENRVVLIPQVTYDMEKTSGLEAELMEKLDGNVTIHAGAPKVSELVSIYSDIDFLVATRMHSAIFALSSRTPVVTIPYDAGGKWGILDMMGAKDIAVPFESITSEKLGSKVEEVYKRSEVMLASVADNLPELSKKAEDNLRLPVSIYFENFNSGSCNVE